VKGFYMNRRLYVQANVFQIDWKDAQTYYAQTISGFPVNGTANGPDAQSRGFEMSARYNLLNNLTLRYSTAYTKAEWSSTKTLCLYTNNTTCRTWAEGGQLGGTPAFKHNFGARYSFEMAGDKTGWASVSGRYVGPIQLDRTDGPTQYLQSYPSYIMWNLRGGVSFDKLDLSFFVENVANKRAVVSEQQQGIMGSRAIYSTPRTIGMNASYTF
jgi:iron complex outermembrane recepter protein